MQVLSWNLFHGRADPPAGRELLAEFGDALAGWDWDVALLQEVPPWWCRPLAERTRASMRMALTSRNTLLPVRAALARRFPDVLKSEGGGANAILVRGRRVRAHAVQELTRTPERRVVHGVALDGGVWVANVHASKQEPRERTERDLRRAAAALDAWAGADAPVVLGGDLNLDHPERVLPALPRMAGGGVDHVLARGFTRVGARTLDAGPLSDHRPIVVELAAG